MRNYQTSG